MSGRLVLFSLGALLASALLVSPSAVISSASATTLAALSTEQMVDASDIIVRGKVVDVWTAIERGHINTHTRIEVSRVLKGRASSAVEVVTPGGALDSTLTEVDGAPRFGVGEEVLVLLAARADGTYLTVSLGAGKYTVKQNPADGSSMVVQFLVPYARNWDHRFIPTPALADRVSLASMETRITDRVAAGWDGQPIFGVSLDHLRAINNLQGGVR
jgi:hypothetical protein